MHLYERSRVLEIYVCMRIYKVDNNVIANLSRCVAEANLEVNVSETNFR